MKAAFKTLLGVAMVFALVVVVRAEKDAAGGKEVTLKGTITCAKCDLKLATKCHTVIKTDKAVYWFDAAGSKKYHKPICMEPMKGTVTGTVTEKDGKKYIKVSKVTFAK